MLASLLTVLFFTLSALTGSRAARKVGAVNANFFRLVIAALMLTAYALLWGQGTAGPGLWIFFFSGVVGFGLGDVALFQAYDHIGPRRTILLSQSLAAPFAALTEWIWLGTRLSAREVCLVGLILLGIVCVLKPRRAQALPARVLWTGTVFGVLAALGQSWGAVLSRKAVALNQAAGLSLDGWTAGFQRIGGGLLVGLFFFAWFRLTRRRWHESGWARLSAAERPRALGLCFLNASAGPVLGVGCYQWALTRMPSGLVLAIVATTPIFMIPFTWATEGDKPGRLALFGSLLAIGGVVGLVLG
jgi:drug/metabolite transporter (DMT)-like permease